MGHGKANSPAAHAVRLAEGVRRDGLVEHSRLRQDRGVPALPDHVAVGLVGEDHHVLTPDQVGDRLQIVSRRHAAGRVVRRIEEDGPGARVGGQELLDVLGLGRKAFSTLSGTSTARACRRWRLGT